ncbi:microcephalin [Macrobrachium rosenbergii]|uniref:microcephalin n=1 Tax=Macrobrachium rosenbergii TaxID=79674 RepID=UPI0034D543CD
MKRGFRRRDSLRIRPPSDNNGTPVSLQSALFSHTYQSTSESVVVPETPNNSFNCPVNDISITGGTVLETPDTPAPELMDISENGVLQALDKGVCDKSFENLILASNIAKVLDKDLISTDEEDASILDVTRELNLQGMNVMSILESEDTFVQSLHSQNRKNSSRINVSKQYLQYVSPVKRKKRRSLAEVILPFDLNDNDTLSKKLQSIQEIKESTSKVRQKRRSHTSVKIKTSKDRQRPLIKSRVSLQFSDLNLKDTSIPKKHNPQVNDTPNTSSGPKGSASENECALFSENEDGDISALTSVNESVIDIIKGLQSQSSPEDAHNGDSFPAKSSVHLESSTFSLPQQQINQIPSQMPSKEASYCDAERNSSSDDFPQTQPASKLILEDVVAYVEVRIKRANHSDVIKDQLKALGAVVREKLTSDVTHVIFRDGSKGTFNRAKKRGLHLVSSLWVDACKETFQRVSEALYPSTSLESYSNPVFLSKLRKQKSMQPRDLSEEERIAEIKAKRKRRVLKSSVGSPSLEENLGICTPKHQSVDTEEDVNSPLFGISHLLTPKQQMARQSGCGVETSSAESDLDASFTTPLSKRLYKRFVTCRGRKSLSQESLDNENETNSGNDGHNRELVVGSPRLPGTGMEENSATDISSSNTRSGKLVKNKCRRNDGNISGVFELHLSSDTNSEPGMADEPAHTSILDTHHVLDQMPRLRRSQRLSLNNDAVVTKRESLCHQDDKVTGKNGSDESVNKKIGTNLGEEHNKVNDGGSIHLSNALNLQTHSGVSNRKNLRKVMLKEKPDLLTGRIMLNTLKGKSDTAACSIVESLGTHENSAHARRCKNLLTDQEGNISDEEPPSSIITPKSKGRRLFSVECLEPSQELIIPSTPLRSQDYSAGPYSDLHVKKNNTRRAAFRELVGSSKVISREKKKIVSRVHRSLTSPSSKASESSLSENVFPSSDDEPTTFKIFPLPRTRKSIEEFEIARRLNGRKQRTSQRNSSLCLTSFHSKERKCVVPIIKKLGRFTVTDEVDNNTSHVVCGAERRTLNVLFGIARGLWILDKSWLYESLGMEKWAPEEPFEVFTYSPGAKICREQREAQGESYRQTLFSSVGSVYILDGCSPPSDQLRKLLSLCGCNVVSSVRNANLVVCNPTSYSGIKNRSQVTYVSEVWVLDSVQHHKVQNLDNYKIVDTNPESQGTQV